MSRALFAFCALFFLAACSDVTQEKPTVTKPSAVNLTAQITNPEIVAFNGESTVCMTHKSCTVFSWQVRNAVTIDYQSGYIEEGQFHSGGFDSEENLPSQGTRSFAMHINNYAVRLCAAGSSGERVCAIYDPFKPTENTSSH